ncbi:hypothetical protein KAI56_04435 [Candidatus Parcubacteria bacterium]|nr:hypothetical protein [Candidatus Parcubacteria bacterium]
MTNKKELQILEPEARNIPDISAMNTFAEMLGKRSPSGGFVQVGVMSFLEIAESIVPCDSGFDKQIGVKYDGQDFVLSRIFEERGWPLFRNAIVLAGVRKYNVDPKDGFIPLAPDSIDIEAAIKLSLTHREVQVLGEKRVSGMPIDLTGIDSKIGVATEYGNGQPSFELIFPIKTKGIWKEIVDIQFNRPTGMVIITPYITLWCECMSINNLSTMPMNIVSVKMFEAIKIAKWFANMLIRKII